jgi:adenylate kinase family enzyme
MGRGADRGLSFDRETMRRIHIIGGSGSGKTTLACRMAVRLGIPVYHLDEIYFGSDIYLKNNGETHRPLDMRLADVSRIAAQSAWITEGNYLWWTEELLRRADMIIWLDIPWRVAAWRIIVRQIRKGLTNPTHQPIGHKLYRFIGFVYRQSKYYLSSTLAERDTLNDDSAKNYVTTAEYLASYIDKLVHCCSSPEVEAFLTGIREDRNSIAE